MTVFRTVPNYEVPMLTKTNITNAWYRFFLGIQSGLPPATETAVTLPASPFTYTASAKGFLIVQGGTVSMISFSRTPGTFYPLGVTQGPIPVSQNDQVMITYSGVPNLVFVPV
jgi:hypothetical protein